MKGKNSEERYLVPAKRLRLEGAKTSDRERESATEGVKTSQEKRKCENIPGERNEADELINMDYKIENTVIVNAEGSDIEVDELLDSIENLCGNGTVMGCVPFEKNVFEVTMVNKDCSDVLIPSLEIGEITVSVSSVNDTSTFVSILHLPAYMTDSQLREKIDSFGVEIVSPVYRRYYKRAKSIRKIADGTRYFRVKFPEKIKSLPWSIAFQVKGVTRYFKTVHDNQAKVCFKCCADDHLARDCVLNQCYTCFSMGHISRNCPKKWCFNCRHQKDECECNSGSDMDDDTYSGSEENSDSDVEDETENGDSMETEVEKVQERVKETGNPVENLDQPGKESGKMIEVEELQKTRTKEREGITNVPQVNGDIEKKEPTIEKLTKNTVIDEKQQGKQNIQGQKHNDEQKRDKANDRNEKGKNNSDNKQNMTNYTEEKKQRRSRMKFEPNLNSVRKKDMQIHMQNVALVELEMRTNSK